MTHKVLLHGRHFPVAMFLFFKWALESLGHEVYSVGPYSYGRIPWGDFYFPKHKFPPNKVTVDGNVHLETLLSSIPFKPDFILQAADTIWLEGPTKIPNFVLATDPHVIDYTPRLLNATHYFYMQNYCKPEKATWIPYAYDKYIHKHIPDQFQEYDVVMCGLQYEHRVRAINALKSKRVRVFNALGHIYEDYVNIYNKGKIALVYSSKEDLPARFWEGLAMRRMVLVNRVPDLKMLDAVDGVDYVSYESEEELVEKVQYYLKHDREREQIAYSGWKWVQPRTYEKRVNQMLDVINTYL